MAASTEVKRLFSAARILGNGDDRVTLSENEMFCLLAQCCADLGIGLVSWQSPPPHADYYRLPLAWFRIPQPACPPTAALVDALAACVAHEPDFRLYFDNLATLHKRRVKYQRILSSQPRPTMNQIGPRCLLEFGGVDDELLASWLLWRKWLFDVDNRSAQETGYLFEPVLASCLGGEAVGSRNSPIKRLDSRGEPTNEGRQIDCYDGTGQLAYEFKLRVTIAASGQGRFGEELSFPGEAKAAGLKPILIVLDPTPSPRLDELSAAFREHGGRCFIGGEAWSYMDAKAGSTMATFLERYIRPPLTRMAQLEDQPLQSIELSWNSDAVCVRGSASRIMIPR